MSNLDPAWQEKFELQIAERRQRRELLLADGDFLDDDGYPTEAALEIIELWHWDDIPGWFEFIQSIWHFPDWGWKTEEVTEPHRREKITIIRQHSISTGGWSGNESIIHAMKKNDMMWHLNWLSSRRGGHFVFQEYVLDK